MSTVRAPAEQRVVLRIVSWNTYLALVAEDSRPGNRICYNQGVMEIMSPGMLHGNAASLIGRMIEIFSMERNIRIRSADSTTFKRDDLERGFEADRSYYLENLDSILDKDIIDLSIDPPPDLAIEVDISRSSFGKFAIYGSIGVGEVWRYDGQDITVYRLLESGEYETAKASVSLKNFPLQEASKLLDQRHDMDDNALIRLFLSHVQEQQN